MEEQIIAVHVPKDQYRKFAQIAWQVNVPMQTILSQFVADFTSDRWGTAEGTMAKVDLCQYFEHKKLKGYADFFNSSSSFCCGVI